MRRVGIGVRAFPVWAFCDRAFRWAAVSAAAHLHAGTDPNNAMGSSCLKARLAFGVKQQEPYERRRRSWAGVKAVRGLDLDIACDPILHCPKESFARSLLMMGRMVHGSLRSRGPTKQIKSHKTPYSARPLLLSSSMRMSQAAALAIAAACRCPHLRQEIPALVLTQRSQQTQLLLPMLLMGAGRVVTGGRCTRRCPRS